jgi:hypothetical protein
MHLYVAIRASLTHAIIEIFMTFIGVKNSHAMKSSWRENQYDIANNEKCLFMLRVKNFISFSSIDYVA